MTWLHENCVPGKSKLVWCLNLGSVDFQFCACNILLICFSSAQSCPTLCGPMDCSTPGLPVRHQLSELTQTHPVSQWCHPTISSFVTPFSSCSPSFPASGYFPVSHFFESDGQSIGASASTSVLLMNIPGWFPLGMTGLMSFQSIAHWHHLKPLSSPEHWHSHLPNLPTATLAVSKRFPHCNQSCLSLNANHVVP